MVLFFREEKNAILSCKSFETFFTNSCNFLLLTDNKNKFCDQFLKIMESTEKNITVNRRAQHEYFILQSYEAGIALVGTEVKALRQNKGNLVDSYATIEKGEVWLFNTNISTYDQGSINNHDPIRKRKLLLKKTEIKRLNKAVSEKGNTLIPLRMYFKNGLVKIELAIASGKKEYDKRESIAKKDLIREMQRKFK